MTRDTPLDPDRPPGTGILARPDYEAIALQCMLLAPLGCEVATLGGAWPPATWESLITAWRTRDSRRGRNAIIPGMPKSAVADSEELISAVAQLLGRDPSGRDMARVEGHIRRLRASRAETDKSGE